MKTVLNKNLDILKAFSCVFFIFFLIYISAYISAALLFIPMIINYMAFRFDKKIEIYSAILLFICLYYFHDLKTATQILTVFLALRLTFVFSIKTFKRDLHKLYFSTLILGIALFIYSFVYLKSHLRLVNEMIANVEDIMKSRGVYAEIDEFKILSLLPAVSLIIAFIASIFTLKVSIEQLYDNRNMLEESNKDVISERFIKIRQIRFSLRQITFLSLIILTAYALSLIIAPIKVQKAVLENLFVLLYFMLLFNGIGYSLYFLNEKTSFVWKFLIIFMMFQFTLMGLFPFALVGFMDMCFDFRKRKYERESSK